MNDKIKDIAKQYIRFDGYDNAIATYGNEELQHFAELIIKHCLGIYESIDNGNHVLGTYDYPEAVVKYFGVE